MRSIVAVSLVAVSLVFTGCAVESDVENDVEGPTGDADEALSAYGKSLVGTWRVVLGASLDLNELVLRADGTFIWHHKIACFAAPCPTRDEGRFIAYRPVAGSVQGRIRLAGNEFGVRNYGVVKGADGTIKLSRSGMTAKLEPIANWCERANDCDGQASTVMVKCIAGYKSVNVCTKSNTCSKDCVKDGAPKACVVTGCSGQLCADSSVITTCEYRAEYACYKTATCERDAAGKCGWRSTPALTKCLSGGSACTYDDPSKKYIGKSVDECKLIMFACVPGTTPFNDACGCGCASTAS